MAAVAGFGGSVVWAGGYATSDTNVYAWTLNYEAGEGETTDFTSSGPKTFISLTTEWSGTFTVRLDGTDVQVAPGTAAASITLTSSAGRTFVGSAFSTGLAISTDVNGIPESVVSFRGTGALTIA